MVTPPSLTQSRCLRAGAGQPLLPVLDPCWLGGLKGAAGATASARLPAGPLTRSQEMQERVRPTDA